MPAVCAEPEVERAPAGDLRARQTIGLAGLARRAAASALYRTRWADAGVDPDALRDIDDLRRFPYISGAALRETWAAHPAEDILCSRNIRVWFATSGTTGAPKWVPYTAADLHVLRRTALRDFFMCTDGIGAADGLRCLVLATPAPFISDGAGYANLFAQIARGIAVEYLLTAYTPAQARASLALAASRRPDAIIAFPSLAMRVAEILSAEAPAAAAAAFREDRTPGNLLRMLATRVVRVSARRILGPRIGLFAGEALEPFRTPLRRAYGLDPFELYAMTEFPGFHLDCREHAGIHLWSDLCVAEVIPESELAREVEHGATPQAVPLLDAAPGATGELVLTTWTEALPLIRYRTSDLITVVDAAPCGCGRTAPRVRVRGRRDDLVNLGVIRFSTVELETRLQALAGPASLSSWQLHVTRDGYKPRPTLLVVPAPGADPRRVEDDARGALLSIDVLRAGVEHGIVLNPTIRVVDRLDDERTWSGKPRRVIERGSGG
jgi:phenylacetate-CoA ligase